MGRGVSKIASKWRYLWLNSICELPLTEWSVWYQFFLLWLRFFMQIVSHYHQFLRSDIWFVINMSPRFFFKYPHITKKNGQKSPCHPHFGASHIAWDSIYRNFWLALTGGGWVGQQDSVKMTLSVTKFDMWVTPNWMKCLISIFFTMVTVFYADCFTLSSIFKLWYLICHQHIT